MKKEVRTFFTAMMFLTRLPVPSFTDHDPVYLDRSPKYFPLVGWIIGGISALLFLVFQKYVSTNTAILASMIGSMVATGAFHEDGFADVCDGFGGGWTKEKILAIMKDSRLGTFGVIGLISILSAKFILLQELPQFTPDLGNPSVNIFYNYRYFIAILITAHAFSRLLPVLVIRFYQYVTDTDVSKSKPIASSRPSIVSLCVGAAFGLLPFIFLHYFFLLAIIPCVMVAFSMANYFKKWIGGYTGDCLGAIQQVTEIVFYLSALLIWKYLL